MSTVNIAEAKKMVELLYKVKQETAEAISIPPTFHGMHGLGKTQVVGQVAAKLGMRYVPLYLSIKDISDLLGMPYTNEAFVGPKGENYSMEEVQKLKNEGNPIVSSLKVNKSTRFATPDWLSDALKDERPALFFLDEMNRADTYVLQCMLPFLIDGTLHTHKIRKKDFVVAAMNPDTPEYNVGSIEDQALLDRLAHFYFEPEPSEWLSYAKDQKIHPAVIRAVSNETSILGKIAVKSDKKINIQPSPRSTFNVGRILNVLTDEEIESNGLSLLSGIVGPDVSEAILVELKNGVELSLEAVLDGSIFESKDKDGNVFIDFESDVDKISIISSQIVDLFVEGKGQIYDFNPKFSFDNSNSDVDQELVIFKKKFKPQLNNLIKFIELMPKDNSYELLRDLKLKMHEKYDDDDSVHDSLPDWVVVSIFESIDVDFISNNTDSNVLNN